MPVIILDRSEAPVSRELVKQHLRVRHTHEDDLIDIYIAGAIEYLETQTGVLGSPTLIEERFSDWSCIDRGEGHTSPLSRSPVREIISVSYLDDDDELQSIAEGDWLWEKLSDGAHIYFRDNYSVPTLSSRPGAARITYSAGFDLGEESGTGDDPDLRLPPTFRQAVLFLVGHWFANREAINIGNIVSNVPLSFEALASQLRVFR